MFINAASPWFTASQDQISSIIGSSSPPFNSMCLRAGSQHFRESERRHGWGWTEYTHLFPKAIPMGEEQRYSLPFILLVPTYGYPPHKSIHARPKRFLAVPWQLSQPLSLVDFKQGLPHLNPCLCLRFPRFSRSAVHFRNDQAIRVAPLGIRYIRTRPWKRSWKNVRRKCEPLVNNPLPLRCREFRWYRVAISGGRYISGVRNRKYLLSLRNDTGRCPRRIPRPRSHTQSRFLAMRRCEVEAGVEGFTEVEDSHEDPSSLIRPLRAAVTPAATTLTPRTTKSTAVAMEQHRNFEGPRGERAEAEII